MGVRHSGINTKREIENYIPLDIYVEAVKKAHQVENITFDNSDYADRCKYQLVGASTKYKQKIRIADDIFKGIQKDGIKAVKEIKAGELKKSILKSVENTASNISQTNKILVAEEVVKLEPKIIDEELRENITKLVKQIKLANH